MKCLANIGRLAEEGRTTGWWNRRQMMAHDGICMRQMDACGGKA